MDDPEGAWPWTDALSESINARRRRSPDGLLLFDRLLALAGLQSTWPRRRVSGLTRAGHDVYPPREVDDLGELLSRIEGCEWDSLKKDCLRCVGGP